MPLSLSGQLKTPSMAQVRRKLLASLPKKAVYVRGAFGSIALPEQSRLR